MGAEISPTEVISPETARSESTTRDPLMVSPVLATLPAATTPVSPEPSPMKASAVTVPVAAEIFPEVKKSAATVRAPVMVSPVFKTRESSLPARPVSPEPSPMNAAAVIVPVAAVMSPEEIMSASTVSGPVRIPPDVSSQFADPDSTKSAACKPFSFFASRATGNGTTFSRGESVLPFTDT